MASYVTLPGSRRTPMPNSRLAGPVNKSDIASVTVRVRSSGDPATLVKKAYELAGKPLAERSYLTHAELEKQYGARQEDLDKVEHFAQVHNLTVVHRSAAERSLVLRGTLGDLLAAFPANVQIYHHASGTYRGRSGEIKVPAELSGIISGIIGFDTRPKHRLPRREVKSAHDGPGGENGVAATEFASRYKFPENLNGTTLDGTGQTIAIIELGGGFQNSDLAVYFKEIGVPPPKVSAISVDRVGNSPGDDADGEVMLDIEVAGAIAPRAKLAVYFAPNEGKGFVDAINAAVHDAQRKPSVISISWGSPEDLIDQQSLDAYHEIFAAAAALGITICAASGDHGTADLDSGRWDGQIHVNDPSCDYMVLGCGGTQIVSDEDVVWNDGTPFDINTPGGGGWATGGGISQIFPVPQYQNGVKLPKALKLAPGSTAAVGNPGRGVPDIAMSATNYFTRVDTSESAAGGTSAVAPLMAALVARLNQALGVNVGFLNPFLYANAAKGVVQAVTKGTNAVKDTCPGYVAGPGLECVYRSGNAERSGMPKNLQSPASA